MGAINWNILCGTQNFTVWNNNDFGYCFEQIVFVCTSNFFLALASAYHLARHHDRRIRGPIPNSPTLHIRFIISVLIALIPLFVLVLVFLYEEIHPSVIDIISWIIKALTWLLHSSFVWRLQRYYHIHIRGKTVTVLGFFLTLASDLIKLRTVILHLEEKTSFFTTVEQYGTFFATGFHVLYLLTLIPYRRPVLQHRVQSPYQAINTGEEDEGRRLVDSGHQDYGTLPQAVSDPLADGDGHANCWSMLTFWWVQPLMKKGSKGLIDSINSLFMLPARLKTATIEDRFEQVLGKCLHEWHAQKESVSELEPTPVHNSQVPNVRIRSTLLSSQEQERQPRSGFVKHTLLRALNGSFGWEYYSLGVLKFVGDGLGFAGPILLNYLILYMENPLEPPWHGYFYAAMLFLSTFLGSMFSTHFNYLINICSLKMRAAIITTVYRKALAVNVVSLTQFSTGEIVNFMSTDTDRIVNFCPSFHAFWSLPVQTAVCLFLLYQQVGWAFLAGLGFTILLIPINRWIAVKIGQLSSDMMEQKDSRVKVMNEILYGIRVIKFYAWESHFIEKVGVLRDAEVKSLKGRKYLDALCVYFWATTPVLISILTFMTYSLMGHQLTAPKVFTSMALLNMLIMPLNAFPWVINGMMEAWVSVCRVNRFIHLSDQQLDTYYTRQEMDTDEVLKASGGRFSWSEADSEDDRYSPDCEPRVGPQNLDNISMSIKKGMLVGVVGRVGAGKSSLLNALLGEMSRESGDLSLLDVDEGFGLVSQEPWIQHATIRDNILFGKTYDPHRYDEVLRACALEEDLKVLPAGDQTEIGENGVTISGGQKARVALARAVYQDKAVYLLDDPLAAVDAHVARHLYEQCVCGLLRDKTRVLCTHHTQYLQKADIVVVMEHGRIQHCGQPQEVLSVVDLGQVLKKPSNIEYSSETKDLDEEPPVGDGVGDGSGTLVGDEERDVGVVRLQVYNRYWHAVGMCLAPMVLLFVILMQASRNVSDWWLAYWVSHSPSNHNSSLASKAINAFVLQSAISSGAYHAVQTLDVPEVSWHNSTEGGDNATYYLMVYGCLAAGNSLLTFIRAFLFAYGGLCAAVSLHSQLLASILKAPISFFDMTPIGRIINRFSTDVYTVDDSLPFIMNILLAQLAGVLGTIVVTCYGLPWFCLLLVPLSVIYYFIQKYYRQTSREIKRLTSISQSPIYAHFSETITGLVTIRALRHQKRFKLENQHRLDENQRAQFSGKAASQWLAIRLQMIGVSMVTGVAFLAVVQHHFQSVNTGLVGLAMSYALSVTSQLGGSVTSFTDTEMQMVSVERVGQYITDVPAESDWVTLHAPPYWPIQGAVSFQHVHLQYRDGLPHALDGVTFETQPAEKVGIVGRTGSGKSSLLLALFRMVEIRAGQVCIDGININHLPLQQVRSRLAIIPQDPFLFSGTVRENLDPTRQAADPEMHRVLQRCHLLEAVQRLGGLDADVGERGHQLSVGQRQLLCLARALLTRAKVLCIDEATASVDRHTDQLIQKTIREEFVNNTVLTIAHRINTVLDCDRVLVMDKGKVAEFEPPQTLLNNPRTIFYSLVHDGRE